MSVNPRLLRFAIFVSFYFLTFGVTLFGKLFPSINVMAYIIAHDSNFRNPLFQKKCKIFRFFSFFLRNHAIRASAEHPRATLNFRIIAKVNVRFRFKTS